MCGKPRQIMNPSFIRKINQELAEQNELIADRLDELMQEVMCESDLKDRSDWNQIQQTLTLMIESMDVEYGMTASSNSEPNKISNFSNSILDN